MTDEIFVLSLHLGTETHPTHGHWIVKRLIHPKPLLYLSEVWDNNGNLVCHG
jgi:hypothetical protein